MVVGARLSSCLAPQTRMDAAVHKRTPASCPSTKETRPRIDTMERFVGQPFPFPGNQVWNERKRVATSFSGGSSSNVTLVIILNLVALLVVSDIAFSMLVHIRHTNSSGTHGAVVTHCIAGDTLTCTVTSVSEDVKGGTCPS